MNRQEHPAKRAGIVCCSNGQPPANKPIIEELKSTLKILGITPVCSDCIYSNSSVFSGTAAKRAQALMDFYTDDSIEEIFDISGGDLANEILPYLDFSLIAQKQKRFWGYSDLTTILNAIYAKTKNPSVLYQVRNLVYSHKEQQISDFSDTLFKGNDALFQFSYRFVQGSSMEGVVVGGNIRCLLKLAGTPFWPDMNNKILLLEAMGGKVPQMVTYLSQLSQMGVFEQINGILLGTFTKMEEDNCLPPMPELIKSFVKPGLPIAVTDKIGHGPDAKAIVIGQTIKL